MQSEKMDSCVTPEEAKNRFECPICYGFLQDPVLTICGHRFCGSCLTKYFGGNEKKCPIDNRVLADGEVFPDNYTKREIAETVVICPNDGCSLHIPAKDYEDHLEGCAYRMDNGGEQLGQGPECPYRTVGCDFKVTSLPLKLAHLRDAVSQHVQLLLKDHNRLSNGFQVCRSACTHTEGCTQSAEDANNISGKLPVYLNDVYTKLTELDQRTKEYEIRLNNVNNSLEQCISETNYVKLTLPEMNNGILLWKLFKFDEILLQMDKDRNYACYSPAFSTCELGYRFRVRLMLSPKNEDALAVLLHVVKGNYDFILKWPFVGEFTVSIIHPLDPNLRLKSIIKTNASEAFTRPVLDINPRGFGFSETVRISELSKQGYLQDNKLIMVVSVKSYDAD